MHEAASSTGERQAIDPVVKQTPWLYAGGLVNELAWSASRAKRFADCLRAYWFTHYGSWGGWLKNARPTVKKLYMLKHLDTRASWVGHAIHEAAKQALIAERGNAGQPSSVAVDEMLNEMRRQYLQSKRGTYRQIKKGFGLIEHELGFASGEKPSDAYFAKAGEQAASGLRTLLSSATFARAAMSRHVDRIEKTDQLELEGTRLWVEPDLSFVPPEDDTGEALEMVDWKTGQPKEGDSEQVVGYVYYAVVKLKVEPEKTKARLVYVGTGDKAEEPSFSVERNELALFEETTLRAIAAMRAKHGQPEEAFPKTTDSKKCEWCCFRGECWPNGQVGKGEVR